MFNGGPAVAQHQANVGPAICTTREQKKNISQSFKQTPFKPEFFVCRQYIYKKI